MVDRADDTDSKKSAVSSRSVEFVFYLFSKKRTRSRQQTSLASENLEVDPFHRRGDAREVVSGLERAAVDYCVVLKKIG